MKVGDKVICIKSAPKYEYDIVINQIYEVSDTLIKVDRIKVKEKDKSYYPTNLFISVEQHRENQLNKIGIE